MGSRGTAGPGVGPDWEDVMDALRAVEGLHGVKCTITVQPATREGDLFKLVLSAVKMTPATPASDNLRQQVYAVEAGLRVGNPYVVAAQAHGLTYKIDSLLSAEAWRAAPLWPDI